MRRYLSILVVLAVLLGLALPAMAGGVKNTTYVKFDAGGTTYDSYWKMNPNGLVHEWRPTDARHFVFKPADRFTASDCDAGDLWTGPSPWTFFYGGYTDYAVGDDGDLTDFLDVGDSYYVCMYDW